MLARLVVSENFNNCWKKPERKCSFVVLNCVYVCNRLKNVTQQMVIFSVDFSHRELKIFETTNYAKIVESQEYVFKVLVILIFYRQKR